MQSNTILFSNIKHLQYSIYYTTAHNYKAIFISNLIGLFYLNNIFNLYSFPLTSQNFYNKEKENCVRTIYSAEIVEDGDHCIIKFHGNGFLRYQVRNMVGILIRVGEEKVSCEEVEKILLSRDRSKYGKTAPSQGLYLVKVNYN